MSELTAILKYQETDKKLFALERELGVVRREKGIRESEKIP